MEDNKISDTLVQLSVSSSPSSPLPQRKVEDNVFAFYVHFPCLDGFVSSWVAWKAGAPKSKIFEFNGPEDVREPPKEPGTVYFLDCSPSIVQCVYFEAKGHNVIIMDHNSELIGLLSEEDRQFYDTNERACIVTWKYFMGDKPVPFLLDFINKEKYDDPNEGKHAFTTDFQWGLLKLKIDDVEELDAIIEGGEARLKEITEIGAQHRKEMSELTLNARKVKLHGMRVVYLKIEPSMDMNGIAMHLLNEDEQKDVDMVMLYRELESDPSKYELFFRSLTPEVDCAEYAKKFFNGGGFDLAACAKVDTLPFTPI